MRVVVLSVAWFVAASMTPVWAEPAAPPDAACAGGDGAACRALGERAYERKDNAAAFASFQAGCKLADAGACGQLGFGFLEGWGGTPDPAKAADSLQQACATAPQYCGALGQLYATGRGVGRDPAQAVALMRRACNLGMYCSHLGMMLADGYGTEIDEPGALAALDQSCLHDDPFGCLVLGSMYERGDLGLTRNAERGRALLQRACKLGSQPACSTVSKLCAAEPATCGVPLVSPPVAQLAKLHQKLVDGLLRKRPTCEQITPQVTAFTHAHASEIAAVLHELDGYGTRGFYVGLDDELLGKLRPLIQPCAASDQMMTALFDAGFRPSAHPQPPKSAPEPSPAAPAGAPPRTVAPQQLEANRVAGDKAIVPDEPTKVRIARHVDDKLVGSFKVCIDKTGEVASVQRLRSTGFPAYDQTIDAGIRTWKYRPFRVDGHAAPVCTAVTFIYSQS